MVSHCDMPPRSFWGLTPRESIEMECARRGTAEVLTGCVELLGRQGADEAPGPAGRRARDGDPNRSRSLTEHVHDASSVRHDRTFDP
jgi:hypothetical protein